MDSVWKSFDAIYCISLISRPDRYERAQRIFNKYQIPVEFYRPTKDPVSGEQGCFNSHTAIARLALKCNYRRILIFEDDIIVNEDAFAHASELMDFLASSIEWNILYFGSLPAPRSVFGYQGANSRIYQTEAWLTHAYALNNQKTLQYVSDQTYFPLGKSIDTIYRSSIPKCYALYPSMFYQGDVSSDIGFQGIQNIQLTNLIPYSAHHLFITTHEDWVYHTRLPAYYLYILVFLSVCVVGYVMKKTLVIKK